jgi:anti-anti-sigma factor
MSDSTLEVQILQLPVAVHVRAAAHMDDLQREFELIRRSDNEADVPRRLQALIEELEERFGGVGEQPNEQLRAAAEQGDETVDLTYLVPAEIGDACDRLLELLDEADEFCRAGRHLLTLATPPESLAYRRWFLGEFIRQAQGEAPQPWRDELVETEVAGTDDVESAAAPPPLDLPDGWSFVLEGDAARVRVVDEVDLAVAPLLRELATHVVASDVKILYLDLTEVPFVDSVGLSVLLSLHHRLDAIGATVVIDPSAQVRDVLVIAGIADLFGVDLTS